jgi:hypothetical protein
LSRQLVNPLEQQEAPAHAISCNDILGPGGNFELQQDLDCPAGIGLTVKDGAILDLNGHIVTCNFPSLGPCVELSGAGAQLLDGAVRGTLHQALRINGTGHTVKNVTSSRPVDDNVVVLGDNNRLINVTATGVINPAFNILGNNNQLSDSIAQCFDLVFSGCINVSGDGNRLIGNYVGFSESNFGLGKPSLQISGNYNLVRRNRTISGDGNGIVVTGTGNDLRHNTALENDLVDLKDENGNCVQNLEVQHVPDAGSGVHSIRRDSREYSERRNQPSC